MKPSPRFTPGCLHSRVDPPSPRLRRDETNPRRKFKRSSPANRSSFEERFCRQSSATRPKTMPRRLTVAATLPSSPSHPDIRQFAQPRGSHPKLQMSKVEMRPERQSERRRSAESNSAVQRGAAREHLKERGQPCPHILSRRHGTRGQGCPRSAQIVAARDDLARH